MPRANTLEKIEKEIDGLSLTDQRKLIEKLAGRLKKSEIGGTKALDWKNLYGLGKGIWKGEDAQDHVNRLREDRM